MASYFPSLLLQNPSAFWVLFALAIPLILHLLSKHRATLVRFSNIALISKFAVKSTHKVHLTEVWLLLLRILLLIVSILLLARISLEPPLMSHEEVYLVSPDWLNHSDKNERQELISSSSNKPIYLLKQHSAPISSAEILAWQPSTAAFSPHNTLLALNAFTALLTPETNIKLFVTNRAKQYHVNQSKPAVTWLNNIDWQIKKLTFEHQKQYIKPMNVVIIYDQDRFADLKYFQQAFALIKQQIAPQLSLVSFLNTDSENSVSYQQALLNNPHWLFYLSSKPPGELVTQAIVNGTNILVDANKADINLMADKRLIIDKQSSVLLRADIAFYRRAQPLMLAEQLTNHLISKTDEVLWQFSQQAGQDLPLLTKSSLRFFSKIENSNTISTSAIYQLYSRFSPAWSNLLVTKQSPLLLQDLLFSTWQKSQALAQQTLNESQINQLVIANKIATLQTEKSLAAPRLKNITELKVARQTTHNDYTDLLVVLLLMLWITERIVSEVYRTNKSTETTVGKAIGTDDNIAISSKAVS